MPKKNFLVLLLFFVSSAFAISINVQILSAGFDDPGYYGGIAKLMVNGTDYAINSRGVNLVVVDQFTGIVLNSVSYDTYVSTANSDNMASFINSLSAGRIVLAAVKDEAVSQMTTAGINALLSLGASSFNQGYRGSWALLGVKGTTGQLQVSHAQYTGPSSISTTINLVPEPTTWILMLAGLVGFMYRQNFKQKN